MDNPSADDGVLFGLLALQTGFITADDLVVALQTWRREKGRQLGPILVEQRVLGRDECALLTDLVARHLAQHHNDVRRSLAALGRASSAWQTLQQVDDPDVRSSLTFVSTLRPEDDPHGTQPPVDDPHAPLPTGTTSAAGCRFRILRPHARGGLGEVFVAHDEELRREVALKEILPRHADNPDSRRRFLLEAEVTGGLEHPGIVPVYGLGTYADGRPFYAMRFIRGDNLQQAIARFHLACGPRHDPGARAFELRQLLGRFVAVCNTIAYAHSRGVLHRDLKPANVMLGPYGETLVVDWGLAKPLGTGAGEEAAEQPLATPPAHGSEATRAGTTIGTPAYMSPEQAAGRLDELGPASDVYALGATLYHLLTGKAPFESPDIEAVLLRVQRGHFAPPRQVNRGIPAGLEAVCLKAMALKPQDRYASARALADDVDHWLADEPVPAYREPLLARLWRWARNHRTLVSSAAAAVLAVLTVGAVALVHVARSRNKAVVLAGANAHLAEKNARLAADERRQRTTAERLSAGLALEEGRTLCEQGEIGRGLLFLTRALKLAPAGDVAFREQVRRDLTTWAGQLHPLRAILEQPRWTEAAAFSPDGKFVLTGGSDGTARLHDASTGRPVGGSLRHDGAVRAVAFRGDGKVLLTGSVDGTARLWDAGTGQPLSGPLRHRGTVWSAVFSRDGTRILTASRDGTARLWDAATGESVGPPLRHQKPVFRAVFSPDGKTAATASDDGTARLWEVATGQPRGEAMRHQDEVWSVAFNPDGSRVLTGSKDGTARLWDSLTGKPLGKPLRHRLAVRMALFSPDGKAILTASQDSTAQLWNSATGEPIGLPLSHRHGVLAAAFSPDGRTLLTGSMDRTARLWERDSGRPLGAPLPALSDVVGVAFSPDGGVLLVQSLGGVRLWEARIARPASFLLPHQGLVTAVAFSPDGRTIATGTGNMLTRRGEVRLWEGRTRKPVGAPIPLDLPVTALAFDASGRRLLAATGDPLTSKAGEARLWDARTRKPLGPPLCHKAAVLSVAFSPDGRTLLTGSQDGTAQLWDAATGKAVRTFRHRTRVWSVAFSPDGRLIATGVQGTVAQLWRVETGEEVARLRHPDAVLGVAFSPDGRFLATGSMDGVARLWNAKTFRAAGTVMQHRTWIRGLTFSPDGRTLLTGSGDKTARLWDIHTGRPLGAPFAHQGWVMAVAFSPDGRTVLTGGTDGAARLWPLAGPVRGGEDLLALWAEVLTGLALDADGVAQLLDAREWDRRRQRLQRLGGLPNDGTGPTLP